MNNKGVTILILAAVFILALISINSTKEESLPPDSNLSVSAEPVTATVPITINKIDSAAVLKMKPHFRVKKDEFSDVSFIRHKSEPRYVNANGIGAYFSEANGDVGSLRFRVQYFSDEWLFIKGMIFLIDGKPYQYVPTMIERDNGDGDIWEWSDEVADSETTDIIQALAGAKAAKIKFVGRQYHDVKTISAAQLKGIKESLQLYLAMGGELQ